MKKPILTPELIAWFVIVAIVIIIIGEMPSQIYDALATPRFRIGNWAVDWWYLSHFWFYMICGAACPGNFWFYMTMGGLFECLESGMGIIGMKTQNKRAVKQYEDFYWFGRWQDVAINAVGYLIGEWTTTGKIDLSFP